MAIAEIGEAKINYELDGQGEETIVLLNGIMMSTASWEDFVQPITNSGYQLLRVDFRDQGGSSYCEKQYGLDMQVEDLKGLVDQLELGKIHLAGISYGGMVALLFAREYQKQLTSLMLFNTPARASCRLQKISDSWEEAARLKDPEMFARLSFPHIYSDDFYDRQGDWLEKRIEGLEEVLTEEWLEGFIRLSISGKYFDIKDELDKIKLPTLVVAGDQDTIILQEDVELLNDKLPNSQMMVFKNCGHASCYESQQEFITSLLGFAALH